MKSDRLLTLMAGAIVDSQITDKEFRLLSYIADCNNNFGGPIKYLEAAEAFGCSQEDMETMALSLVAHGYIKQSSETKIYMEGCLVVAAKYL